MTPPRQRKGAEPAKAPQIQPRPAEPAQGRQTASELGADAFPPNPVPGVRQGRPRPYTRYLQVIGPHEVGGVKAPGWLELDLSDQELEALVSGGHVKDYPAGAGWGEDAAPDPEPEAEGEPKDEPKAGADKEGN